MKRMLIFAWAALIGMAAGAQKKSSGIYLTQADFENGKLSYASNAVSEKNKIHFNELLDKHFVTIKHNGEKMRLYKDEIFAYQNKGRIVFTRNFVPYTFAEQGTIWIYYKDLNVALGKGVKRERRYYYSVSGKDEVVPLTVSNLKRSFPGKHLFHNFLDAQFRNDAELAKYDGLEKKFKVNHLLDTTLFEAASR